MSNFLTIRWYVQGFLSKYGKVLGISAVIGILIFILLPSILASIPLLKSSSYIGRVGSFQLARLPKDLQEKVSFGLMKPSLEGQLTPALASSFDVEEDGKAYRFVIRPNVYWQDGREVTPQDISYTFADIDVARSKNDIIYRIRDKVEGETAPDTFLPSSFLSLVSQPLFRQEKKKQFIFQTKNVIYGLGEYRITSLQYQGPNIKEIVLESDRERLIYRFYPTESDAIIAFKRGEVDRLENIQVLGDIGDWSTVSKRLDIHEDQYVGIFFNLSYQDGDDQPYNNRSLRQALNLSLQKTQGNARILSPIQRKSWAYVTNEEDLDGFEQNLTEAVSTLLKSELRKPSIIELTTIPSYVAKAESIKQSWETLGEQTRAACTAANDGKTCENYTISVQIRIANVPDLSNYQVLLVGQQIPFDPDQYSLWHSTQASNFTRYKNARVDKLLEDARKTSNREERKLLYQEFQRILVKDSPAIFLEPISTYTVWKKTNIL